MDDAKTYTYNLPDDYELTPEMRTKLDELVEETLLTNDEAQKFIDLHIEVMEKFVKDFQDAHGEAL